MTCRGMDDGAVEVDGVAREEFFFGGGPCGERRIDKGTDTFICVGIGEIPRRVIATLNHDFERRM